MMESAVMTRVVDCPIIASAVRSIVQASAACRSSHHVSNRYIIHFNSVCLRRSYAALGRSISRQYINVGRVYRAPSALSTFSF